MWISCTSTTKQYVMTKLGKSHGGLSIFHSLGLTIHWIFTFSPEWKIWWRGRNNIFPRTKFLPGPRFVGGWAFSNGYFILVVSSLMTHEKWFDSFIHSWLTSFLLKHRDYKSSFSSRNRFWLGWLTTQKMVSKNGWRRLRGSWSDISSLSSLEYFEMYNGILFTWQLNHIPAKTFRPERT